MKHTIRLILACALLTPINKVQGAAATPIKTKIILYLEFAQKQITTWNNTLSQSPNEKTIHSITNQMGSLITSLHDMIIKPDLKTIRDISHDIMHEHITKDYVQPLINHINSRYLSTYNWLCTLENEHIFTSDFFSPDEKFILTIHNKTAKIWEINNKKLIHTLEHTYPIHSATFTKNEKYIHITQFLSESKNDIQVTTWNVDANQPIPTTLPIHTDQSIRNTLFSFDKTQLLINSRTQMELWNLDKKTLLHKFINTPFIISIALSPNGKKIAIGSSSQITTLFDVDTKNYSYTLNPPVQKGPNIVVSFNYDSTKICVGLIHNCYIWSTITGELIATQSVFDYGNNAFFSPYEDTIISQHGNGTVTIWNVLQNTQTILEDTQTQLTAVAVNHAPNSSSIYKEKILIIPSDPKTYIQLNKVELWDYSTNKLIQTIVENLNEKIQNAIFSPQGTYIAITSTNNTYIYTKLSTSFIQWLKNHATADQIAYLAHKLNVPNMPQHILNDKQISLLWTNKQKTGFEQTMHPGALHFLTNVLGVTKPTQSIGRY